MKSLFSLKLFVVAIVAAILFRFTLSVIRKIPLEDWAEKKIPFFSTLVYGVAIYIILLIQRYSS